MERDHEMLFSSSN